MNRRVACCAAIVVCGFVAVAAASPPVSFRLEIEMSDLTTWIRNDNPFPTSLTAYSIESASGILDPSGWRSIADAGVSDLGAVTAALGSGGLSFLEFGATNTNVAEGNIVSSAIFQAGTRWSIGRPFGTSPSQISSRPFDARFLFVEADGGVFEGAILFIPVPELAALETLACCSVASVVAFGRFMRRRR